MKKTRTNNYSLLSSNKKIKDIFIENYKIIILVIIIAMGLVYSLISYQAASDGDNVIFKLLSNQQEIKATQTFLDCFSNSIITYSIYYCVVFLFGMCALGLPMLIVAPFVYGIQIGYQIMYLYTEFSSKGVGYTALVVAPIAILFGIVLIFSLNEALSMSWDIFSAIQDGTKPRITINVYIKRFAVFAFVILAATAIFSLVNIGISKLITL